MNAHVLEHLRALHQLTNTSGQAEAHEHVHDLLHALGQGGGDVEQEHALLVVPVEPLSAIAQALREYDDTLATPGQARDIADADLIAAVRSAVEVPGG